MGANGSRCGCSVRELFCLIFCADKLAVAEFLVLHYGAVIGVCGE